MSFFKDIFGIFKKSELTFVKKIAEADDVYTFVFEKDKDLVWHAGQHGLFTITHKKIKDSIRPFTVASIPAEEFLKITTVISPEPSEFKKALLELEKGMKMTMSGPVGSFYLKSNDPALLIAGGIGITPFRAILKQLEQTNQRSDHNIKLIYLDSKETYVYKAELDELSQNVHLDNTYVSSRDQLYEEINHFASTYAERGQYLIAGPKSMVTSVTQHLKNVPISNRKIYKDSFTGYIG